MQVIIASCAAEVATLGARYCLDLINSKQSPVLGLATGSTPVALYKELIEMYENNQLSFKQTHTFNLDEYLGLATSHPQSYRYFMNSQLFQHIDIDLNNTYVPNGMSEPKTAASEYEAQIKHCGGIDLQILGVGRNGHIGFNEPSSSLVSRTRVKTLAKQTLDDNKRFFNPGEFQPSLAITMGIGTILEADKILLLATGSAKANAIKELVEGPLSASCPASALQMHRDTIVIIDTQAAAALEHQTYYQQVTTQTEQLDYNND
ncbi:MAG: glucosamine-6-phosphate deaminase [Oceanospirillaceae bacterium]|nr:glucosamine-6-phosphate deaminase [Oceanospirillaceae bacterium]